MKNRRASAHENTSQNKTKIGTTLIMGHAVIMVFSLREIIPGDGISETALTTIFGNGVSMYLII